MDRLIILAIIAIGGIFLVYFLIIIPFRKTKYKKLADDLNTKYISLGRFRIGKVVGIISKKEFMIEPYIKEEVILMYCFYTKISLECKNRGIPLVIFRKFFKDYPNWEGIFNYEDYTFKPVEEEYKMQINSTLQETSRIFNEHIKKGDLFIDENIIIFETLGILSDSNKIIKVLDLLTKTSDNIERNPIIINPINRHQLTAEQSFMKELRRKSKERRSQGVPVYPAHLVFTEKIYLKKKKNKNI